MKQLVLVVLTVTAASAQMVHELPFASKDNSLELVVENSASLAARNVTIQVVAVPAWIHLESRDQAVGQIPGNQEAVTSFKFSVDKSAPVQKEDVISFAVVSETGQRWTKEIRVSVAPPAEFSLFQNYPNPFNPTTIVGYQLAAESKVRLSAYDLLGREVIILADGDKSAGYHTETLSATELASGVYILRLVASHRAGKEFASQRMMTVVK